MELEAKIADLGFSAKRYFLYNFFFKNFVWKCFSQNLKFYVCGLRSETENCKKYFLFWNFWKNKSKISTKKSKHFSRFFGDFLDLFFKNSKIKKGFFSNFHLKNVLKFFGYLDLFFQKFQNKIYFLQISVSLLNPHT